MPESDRSAESCGCVLTLSRSRESHCSSWFTLHPLEKCIINPVETGKTSPSLPLFSLFLSLVYRDMPLLTAALWWDRSAVSHVCLRFYWKWQKPRLPEKQISCVSESIHSFSLYLQKSESISIIWPARSSWIKFFNYFYGSCINLYKYI